MPNPKPDSVTVADGKYTVVIDGGKLSALRYGEPWQDLCGNNLVYWLAVELRNAREADAELVEAAQEVIRISDRKHNAWDRLKAAIDKVKGG